MKLYELLAVTAKTVPLQVEGRLLEQAHCTQEMKQASVKAMDIREGRLIIYLETSCEATLETLGYSFETGM